MAVSSLSRKFLCFPHSDPPPFIEDVLIHSLNVWYSWKVLNYFSSLYIYFLLNNTAFIHLKCEFKHCFNPSYRMAAGTRPESYSDKKYSIKSVKPQCSAINHKCEISSSNYVFCVQMLYIQLNARVYVLANNTR